MKHFHRLLIMIGILMFGISIPAQYANPVSGSDASGTGGTISYSIGQVVYTVLAGTVGNIIQGVQQPYEISIIIGSEDIFKNNLKYSIYPNPTDDYLILKISDNEAENLSYQLYNIQGKVIQYNKIMNRESKISMNSYVSGIYLIKIYDKNREIMAFKIIKN